MEHISGERDMKKREEIKRLVGAAHFFEERSKSGFVDTKDIAHYKLAAELIYDALEGIQERGKVTNTSGQASFNYPFLTGMTVEEKHNE